ncbi:three-prime repair exonuclease 1 [Drosophila grimshawi]|uniref:GH11086 n=1 Tax=Drosophila grimshawi TaxID=7222 RepID=B4JCS3_DROGR|nr:three-prime repair exonuclease 1 [Drosophila grimshawi]EDW03162.1 GH11086 [Drosophila grimshawi]
MNPNAPVEIASPGLPAQISTFAVLDLETSNLPVHNRNRVSITELCIYAFDPAVLKGSAETQEELQTLGRISSPILTNRVPEPPRVMHKLNLLFQPSMMVHPDAERVTGLNNYILERESKLDENAAHIVLKFLEHLPPPVCLVAHNGWEFDFPIVRNVFEKLKLNSPPSILCVDSLRAFMEIDDKLSVKNEDLPPNFNIEPKQTSESNTNWQAVNETTPKRPILSQENASLKRKILNDEDDDKDADTICSDAKRSSGDLRVRRQLFTGLKCAQTKRYPPRGRYRLSHLYERTFEQPAENCHQAEADVIMLTRLIQRYGVDFLAFAEEQAIPFKDVVPLGSKSSK